VPSNERPKKRLLAEYLRERRIERIGDREWRDLAALLAPVSESYLRRLLRESGRPLDPLVEGVRQDSPAEAERTLLALLGEYEAARAAGDRPRQQACRDRVILAKDHARLALRRLQSKAAQSGGEDPERDRKHREKEELILWMITWLENPAVFRQWLALRQRAGRAL
jgi:hypothetical protein